MLSEPRYQPSLDSLSSDSYSGIVDHYIHIVSPVKKKTDEEDLVALVPLPKPPFPDGGRKAWSVVLGCWCTCFVSFGIVNSFGVYETYYLQTFLRDHSPSTVAWIGSIQVFALFAANIVSGPLLDRYGPSMVIWPSSVLLVVSSVLVSVCNDYGQFLISQGLLVGFSAGFLFGPALSVIGHYFMKRRPLAMALASTGSPIGGVIYPVILTNMLPEVGFAWAQRTCTLLTIILLLCAAILIRPTGIRRESKTLMLEAFKTPAYSLQAAALFILVWGLFSPYFYLAEYALSYGMSDKTAEYLFAVINAGSLAGRLLAGVLASRVGLFNVVVIACYGTGITVFCWVAATSPAGIIVIGVIYGIFSGIIIALMFATVASTADHPSKIGTYIGQVTFAMGFAALGGLPATGALMTRSRSFAPGIEFSGAAIMIGAILLSVARYFAAKNKLIA